VLDRDGPSVQFTYHSHDGEQGTCSLILSALEAHMLKSDLANDLKYHIKHVLAGIFCSNFMA
jgi:hypothetical protein